MKISWCSLADQKARELWVRDYYNRPFYSCVLSFLAFEWNWQNKVNSSLTFIQRPGDKAHNCKAAYLALSSELIHDRSNFNRKTVKDLENWRFESCSLVSANDEGLTLEMSAFQIFHGGNSTYRVISFDKTTFSCFTLLPTQHHSFYTNHNFFNCYYGWAGRQGFSYFQLHTDEANESMQWKMTR